MTTNPRNIQWPQDSAGFLYGLKSAGIKAVERQMGNPEKHEALMLTLKALYAHAKGRYALQAATRAERIAAAAAESEPQASLDLTGTVAPVEPEVPVPAPAGEAVDPKEAASEPTDQPDESKA